MKIAIDARALRWTGIGRYVKNVITGVLGLESKNNYTLLLRKQDITHFKQLIRNLPLRSKYKIVLVENSYYSWREQLIFPLQLMRLNVDLIHFTHFNIPLITNQPYIVTIHDITRFIFPGDSRSSFFQQMAYETVFKHAVEKSQGVITVSKSTQNDLLQLPIKVPRHSVIYEGVGSRFLKIVSDVEGQRMRDSLKIHGRYILHVGVWMSHKNINRLLLALKIILQQHPDIKLVMTGNARKRPDSLLRYIKKLGLAENILLIGFVPESLLPALYSESECFVFPSLYEGFGLPVLEAAACGVPVVTSNVSSLPEITSKASLFINPESVDDLAAAILSVFGNDQLKNQLKAQGKKQALNFSWQTTIQKHLQFYQQSLISNS